MNNFRFHYKDECPKTVIVIVDARSRLHWPMCVRVCVCDYLYALRFAPAWNSLCQVRGRFARASEMGERAAWHVLRIYGVFSGCRVVAACVWCVCGQSAQMCARLCVCVSVVSANGPERWATSWFKWEMNYFHLCAVSVVLRLSGGARTKNKRTIASIRTLN